MYWSYRLETKIWICRRQIIMSKNDEICQLVIQNQISTISMHKSSLVKIQWFVLNLSSKNENMDMSRADNSVKNWQNLPISNPKPDLYNINAYTMIGKNPLIFSQVIIRKYGWEDRQTYKGQTHTQTANPTLLVAGYKNYYNQPD